MKDLIKKHQIPAYFVIAFGWAWIIVFILIFSGAVEDVTKPTPAFIFGGLLCNIAPTMAALIITGVVKGKKGLSELKKSFTKKVGKHNIVLTISIVPVLFALTTIFSHFTIREYRFNLVAPLIILGLIWPLFSSFGEEFGWRGFVLPVFLKKQSPLVAGIVLGLIWSIWHIPMDYIAYRDYGVYMLPTFLLTDFVNLTLQSVIMTYIFTKTGGSLKLMVLYHYTITASAILSSAFFTTKAGPLYGIYESLLSVSLYFVLAVILFSMKKTPTAKLDQMNNYN